MANNIRKVRITSTRAIVLESAKDSLAAIYSETNGACGTFDYDESDLLDALEDQEEAAAELQEALDRFDSAVGGAEFYRVCVSC